MHLYPFYRLEKEHSSFTSTLVIFTKQQHNNDSNTNHHEQHQMTFGNCSAREMASGGRFTHCVNWFPNLFFFGGDVDGWVTNVEDWLVWTGVKWSEQWLIPMVQTALITGTSRRHHFIHDYSDNSDGRSNVTVTDSHTYFWTRLERTDLKLSQRNSKQFCFEGDMYVEETPATKAECDVSTSVLWTQKVCSQIPSSSTNSSLALDSLFPLDFTFFSSGTSDNRQEHKELWGLVARMQQWIQSKVLSLVRICRFSVCKWKFAIRLQFCRKRYSSKSKENIALCQACKIENPIDARISRS